MGIKNKIIFGVFVLLLAGGVGYYIWKDINKKPLVLEQLSQSQQQNQNNQLELEQIQQLQPPNLDRPISIPPTLVPEAQKLVREKIEKLTSELKENPNLFDNWLLLGIYRKMIGDYEGAKECWEYAAIVNPQSPTPFNNLGDLYANFMKDNQKAEENFLKAIKIDPSAIYIYRSLYEFYHYNLKDDAKAKAILEQGISVNPTTSQDLQNLLNGH